MMDKIAAFFEKHKFFVLIAVAIAIALYLHLRKKKIQLYQIQGDPAQGTGDYTYDPSPLVEKLYEAAKNDSYFTFSSYFYDLYDEPVSVLINLSNANFKSVHNAFNSRHQNEFGKSLDTLIVETTELSDDLKQKYNQKRVALFN